MMIMIEHIKLKIFLNKFDNVNIYTVTIRLDLSTFGINTTPYWKISYLDAGSTSYISWIYLTIYNNEYEVRISDTMGSNPTIHLSPDIITVHPYIKGDFAISKLTDDATNVDCINKINELIDGLYNLKAVKRLISFTIDRSAWNGGIITCVAVEGMTWSEWQHSEYSEDAKESNGELTRLRLSGPDEEIPYRYLWRESYQNDDGYGLCRTDEDGNPILLDADSSIDDGGVYVEEFTTNYEY